MSMYMSLTEEARTKGGGGRYRLCMNGWLVLLDAFKAIDCKKFRYKRPRETLQNDFALFDLK